MHQIYRRTAMLKYDFNKVVCNFIGITLRHGCSPVNLLRIFRITFVKTSMEGCLCNYDNLIHLNFFFYKQRFFSTQPLCYLTFSSIELQMLLRCCLIHISIIILRHFLYLLIFVHVQTQVYLYRIYVIFFFIFIFIFIMINHIIS